jgi:cell division protease FtsH
LFLGQVSTGALNDLERVTKQAWAIIVYYGMSDSLNNLSYFDSSGTNEFSFTKPYSEKTAEKIDEEVKKLVNEQYERAKRILSENAAKHNELANILVDREVLFAEDLERIFGKRPWTSRTQEILEEQKRLEDAKTLAALQAQTEGQADADEQAADAQALPESVEAPDEEPTTEEKKANDTLE